MQRRGNFYKGEFVHVFNKSIANFKIFNNPANINRFLLTVQYYNTTMAHASLSKYLKKASFYVPELLIFSDSNLIKIISYCVMPDHYHLLIKMIVENALSKYINIIENSYSRYLNKKINRKGPLWQTRFKTVKIKNNEQLLHVSRYIHLNPTTSGLVKKPEDWGASSYHYFINGPFLEKVPEISIRKIDNYKKFTEDQIDYQKKLKIIKRKLLE